MERVDTPNIDQLWQRIAKIRQYFCDGNNVLFATKIGKDPTYTSQLCTGSKNAGSKIIKEILNAFPDVRNAWLLTGDGQMLVNGNNIAGDNNSGIVGNGNTQNSIPSDDLKSLIKAISTLTETNRQQSDQIGQLIRMLSANN